MAEPDMTNSNPRLGAMSTDDATAAARERLRAAGAPPMLIAPDAPIPPIHLPISRGGAQSFTQPRHDDDDEIAIYRERLSDFLDAHNEDFAAFMEKADLGIEVRRLRIREQARVIVQQEQANAMRTDAQTAERAQLGGDAILDEPASPPALWGSGSKVAWARGQGMMLASHQGLGKTTLAQQLVLHRMQILTGRFLGMAVEANDRPVLYLAMDRPSQALQSFRRMVTEEQRHALNQSLTIWRGPLPINITSDTSAFADFVQEISPDCGLVVVDSVKDLVPGISKDEIGSALNIGWQELIARAEAIAQIRGSPQSEHEDVLLALKLANVDNLQQTLLNSTVDSLTEARKTYAELIDLFAKGHAAQEDAGQIQLAPGIEDLSKVDDVSNAVTILVVASMIKQNTKFLGKLKTFTESRENGSLNSRPRPRIN